MRRLLAGSLIAVLVLLLVAEFTLPGVAGRALEQELAGSSLRPEGVKAHLFAFPAARLLLGQYDGLRLELKGVTLQGCRVSQVVLRVPRGSFSPVEVLEGRGMDALHPAGPVQAQLVFKEADLNVYLRATGVPGIADPGLKLYPRYVKLQGRLGLWGSSLAIQLWGNFRPEADGSLAFSPLELKVGRESLPPELTQRLVSRLRFQFNGRPGGQLPFAFRVKQVNSEMGSLVVSGESI